MSQKGFIPIIILLIVAGILVFGGVLYFGNKHQALTTTPANATPSSCTLDANGLPPDPGEAGKQTLTGMDCDHDGVRDDIQRYIALTYPQSAKERAALTQDSLAVEAELTDTGNYGQQLHDASDCIGATFMHSNADVAGGRNAENADQSLIAIVLNTPERTKAYFEADGRLGGSVTISTPWAQMASRCTVDPSTLPS